VIFIYTVIKLSNREVQAFTTDWSWATSLADDLSSLLGIGFGVIDENEVIVYVSYSC